MCFKTSFFVVVLLIAAQALAGSPAGLDFASTSYIPSSSIRTADANIFLQNGRIVSEEKTNKTRPYCIRTSVPADAPQKMYLWLSWYQIEFPVSDNWPDTKFSHIQFQVLSSLEEPRVLGYVDCWRPQDRTKPSAFETNEIQQAFGKHAKFHFVFQGQPQPFFDFTAKSRQLRLRVNQSFVLRSHDGGGVIPIVAIAAGGEFHPYIEPVFKEVFNKQGLDTATLSIAPGDYFGPATFKEGDELITASPYEFTSTYSNFGPATRETQIIFYHPGLKRYFNFLFSRRQNAVASQGSILDVRSTLGKTFTIEEL